MKFKLIAFIISFFCIYENNAQNNDSQAAVYNVALGSVFSGIGAIINKKPTDKWHKTLLKGMGQGAMGGLVIFESKRMLRNVQERKKWEYAWAAKFINATGTSIVENASSNRPFASQWHINFGFLRVELHTKEKFKIKPKIMPIALTRLFIIGINNKFEFKRSLQTGELFFSTNNLKLLGDDNIALSTGNGILIKDSSFLSKKTSTHEIIHNYQYNDYNFVNTYLNKPFDKLCATSKTFNSINKFVYWDLQVIPIWGLYLYENRNYDINKYYDNFFEHEAGYYSDTLF